MLAAFSSFFSPWKHPQEHCSDIHFSTLCCELLAQVKMKWEGAAAFAQALPEGAVPESSIV